MGTGLAAIATVIALTECPQCNARAGQGCRGRGRRVMFASTHSARRYRAARYRKANPAHYWLVREMARELSRAEYIEQITAADTEQQ